jgi:hypothetical protein
MVAQPSGGKRPPIVEVNGLLNVWTNVAQAWQSGGDEAWVATVTLKDPQGALQGEYEMALPLPMSDLPSTPIYFAHDDVWSLDFGHFEPRSRSQVRDHTSVLLALNFRHRQLKDEAQNVVLFASRADTLTIDMVGGAAITSSPNLDCLVRDEAGLPAILETVLRGKPARDQVQKVWKGYTGHPGFEEAPDTVPWIAIRKWPRRVDFLHRPGETDHSNGLTAHQYYRAYPAEWYKADTASRSHAGFGLLIPSILHHVKVRIIAQTLSTTLLGSIAVSDQSLILTAISAGAANEPVNYERLEILGDTVLKLFASLTVAAIRTHDFLVPPICPSH